MPRQEEGVAWMKISTGTPCFCKFERNDILMWKNLALAISCYKRCMEAADSADPPALGSPEGFEERRVAATLRRLWRFDVVCEIWNAWRLKGLQEELRWHRGSHLRFQGLRFKDLACFPIEALSEAVSLIETIIEDSQKIEDAESCHHALATSQI